LSEAAEPLPPPQTKRARRKEARPGELLAAALELFAEKGFAATRAEEVAQRAGVSKGTLFLYFASKEELFKAVVREHIAQRFPTWDTEVEAFAGTSSELLRLSLLTWWERVGNTSASAILRLMLAEAQNFPELASFYQQEVVLPGQRLLRRILQRGIDRGEFRAMDTHYAVYALLAPMLFLVAWKHAGRPRHHTPGMPQIVPEDYIAAQLDIVLQGLQRHPAAPGASTPTLFSSLETRS
jgi:AcrR family transcriptional regulator